MLNVYLTLQQVFGRLHSHGLDVQVEDAWSASVSEDGLMPTLVSMLLFWSLNSSATIRLSGVLFTLRIFMFEEPLSTLWDVSEIFEIIILCCFWDVISAVIVYD